MAFLDGTLNGYLSHDTQLTAKSGVKINEAIKTSVQYLPKVMIDSFDIEGLDVVLPYDMEFNPNGTVFNIIKSLVDLHMSQEFYFDTNGTFKVQRIRDRSNDPIIWDFTEDNMDLSIDYINEINMANVKNSIHIWGATNENTGIQTYWVYRNRWARENYSGMSELTGKQKGDICHVINESNSYVWDESNWKLLEFTVIPQFNIENIGEKIWSYSDDKIFDELQAKLRAEYELQQTSNFAETISLSCVPIYLLEPNNKIRLKDKDTGIDGDYLINTLNIPLNIDSPMNITAHKIYY